MNVHTGIGVSILPQGRPPLHHRPRQLRRRHQAARTWRWAFSCARRTRMRDQVYRHQAPRSRMPGVAAVSTPAPISRRTGSTDCPAAGASGNDGHADEGAAASGHGVDKVRCVGDAVGLRGRRNARTGTRSGRRDRWSITRCYRPSSACLTRCAPGAAARVRRYPRQYLLRLGLRRQGDGGRVQECRPCRQDQSGEQPPCRQSDGAARGDRGIRSPTAATTRCGPPASFRTW